MHIYIGAQCGGCLYRENLAMTSHHLHFSDNSLLRDDEGSATAEYAIATLAAVGFAGLLVAILRGDEVKSILAELIKRALGLAI